MAEFLPVRYSPTAPTRGRHNVSFRPAESVVLQAVFALSPHELLVNDLAVEHDYFRTTDCLQFPIEDISTPDELSSRYITAAFGRTFYQVRQSYPKLDYPGRMNGLQAFGHKPAIVKERPKLVAATGVVVSCPSGD
jgi:hypothetical protein